MFGGLGGFALRPVRLHQAVERLPVHHLLCPLRPHGCLRRLDALTVVHMLHENSPPWSGASGPEPTRRRAADPAGPPASGPHNPTTRPYDKKGPIMSADTRTGGEWLQAWDPGTRRPGTRGLAWKTLWITTFCLTSPSSPGSCRARSFPSNALGHLDQEPALLDGPRCRSRRRPLPAGVDGPAAHHGHARWSR